VLKLNLTTGRQPATAAGKSYKYVTDKYEVNFNLKLFKYELREHFFSEVE